MIRKILALFAVVAIAYFFVKGRGHENMQTSNLKHGLKLNLNAEESEKRNLAVKNESPVLAQVSDPTPERANVEGTEAAAKAFPDALKALGACFDIRNQVNSDRIQPTLAQLIDSLRGEIGDSIAEYEDWSNEHIIMANGEQRRLRIENGADANGIPGRFLRYFKLDKQGLPEIITLPPEQSQNPSDETLNLLRADGQRSLYERNLRSYFQNGEEVVTTEKNGFLQDLEMTKGAKNFKCSNLNSEGPNCRCSDY